MSQLAARNGESFKSDSQREINLPYKYNIVSSPTQSLAVINRIDTAHRVTAKLAAAPANDGRKVDRPSTTDANAAADISHQDDRPLGEVCDRVAAAAGRSNNQLALQSHRHAEELAGFVPIEPPDDIVVAWPA